MVPEVVGDGEKDGSADRVHPVPDRAGIRHVQTFGVLGEKTVACGP